MLRTNKLFLSLSVVVAIAAGLFLSQSRTASAGKDTGVLCVMDVTVESRNQSGTVIGTELYHKEFVLLDGGFFSEDFSTRTRFKFFDASMNKANGETTIRADWFADVTVFNSVDVGTSVVLTKGQKQGKSVGNQTVYTSTGSTESIFSLTVIEN